MKKLNNILIVTGGLFCFIYAIGHLMFWDLFAWDTELAKLLVVNSNIMQMLNLSLCVLMICFGIILLFYRQEILTTRLGRAFLSMLTIMFIARLIMEFAFPEGSLFFGGFILFSALFFLVPLLGHTENHSVK